MNLQHLLTLLRGLDQLTFRVEGGPNVPSHAHITEVGIQSKSFIDCGNTRRTDEKLTFQIWVADDVDHQLAPMKFAKILEDTSADLGAGNLDITVEHMTGGTIGLYGLDFDGHSFVLTPTHTDCLAKSKCGFGETDIQDAEVKSAEPCCSPSTGCC